VKLFHLAQYGPVVSKWFWNAGVSERFVIAMPDVARSLSERIVFAKESIDHYGFLNSEYLMDYSLQRLRQKPIAVDVKFSRVRLNQKIHPEKFYPAYWRPYEIWRVFVAQTRAKYYHLIGQLS
jgi:hypothetical protein